MEFAFVVNVVSAGEVEDMQSAADRPWTDGRGRGVSAAAWGVAWLSTTILAGCVRPVPPPRPEPAPPRTQVRYQAVADKHLKHYRLAPSQSAISPDPQPDNPVPDYPPGLVSSGLPPVTVTALLVVDARGLVQDVRIAGEATDDAVQRRFDSAVREATRHWRFTPMRIANWVEDAAGNAHRVSADPRPFSQVYRFRFAIRDGKPQVSGAPPPVQR